MSATEATPAFPDRWGPDFWSVVGADPEWFVNVLAPQLIGTLSVIGRLSDPAEAAERVLSTVEKAVEQKRAKLPRSKR